MRWAGYVKQMGARRNAYRILGKPDGKRPLGRPRHKWVENIIMDLLKAFLGNASVSTFLWLHNNR
jgi:hypothetical protein